MYIIIFFIFPLSTFLIAFEDFSYSKGIFSDFVGLQNFRDILSRQHFLQSLTNSFQLGIFRIFLLLAFGYISAIVISKFYFRRWFSIIIIISLLPQFISWLMLSGIFRIIFSYEGYFNSLFHTNLFFFTSHELFYTIIFYSMIWHDGGLYTFMLLIGVLAIDRHYYDSAYLYTSSRFSIFRYITLPMTKSYIYIILLMLFVSFFSGSFEAIYNLHNPILYEFTDTVDTYILRTVFLHGDFSRAFALDLIKSCISLVLILPIVFFLLRLSRVDFKENHLAFSPSKPNILDKIYLLLFLSIFLFPFVVTFIPAMSAIYIPFTDMEFLKALWNSLSTSLIGAILSSLTIILTAYSLFFSNRKQFNRLAKILVFLIVFNSGFLGLYIILTQLKLINSLFAIYLPFLFYPFYFFYTYYRILEYPQEVVDAICLETDSKIILILQLCKYDLHFIFFLFITLFIFTWNNWLAATLFLNTSEQYTVQSYVAEFFNGAQGNGNVSSDLNSSISLTNKEQLSYIYIACLPALLVFLSYKFLHKGRLGL